MGLGRGERNPVFPTTPLLNSEFRRKGGVGEKKEKETWHIITFCVKTE